MAREDATPYPGRHEKFMVKLMPLILSAGIRADLEFNRRHDSANFRLQIISGGFESSQGFVSFDDYPTPLPPQVQSIDAND